MKQFKELLISTFFANLTTNFLWFAFTFWVYLETKSVLLSAIMSGSMMLLSAFSGMLFGTLVDKYPKKAVMEVAGFITFSLYFLAFLLYLIVPQSSLLTVNSAWFWLMMILVLTGGTVNSARNIALATCVTLLVDEPDRAKANGQIGIIHGVGFTITSVFSGLAIGRLGMGRTFVIALVAMLMSIAFLFFIKINEKLVHHDAKVKGLYDIRGALKAIGAVPGLAGLILFATLNNFFGGTYMALLDPYGLNLVSVEVWGVIYGLTSIGFILGGLAISKFGVGKRPVRLIFLGIFAMSIVGGLFAIRENIVVLVVGMIAYMTLAPIVEAAEQTTLQKVVPFEKQGRVFGFAQSVETASAPITAFLIGPIAEFWAIPYMNSSAGKSQLGWLLGTGSARGIALIFLLSAIFMTILVILATRSKSYHLLDKSYQEAKAK